jgi:hypothetical protein
MSTTNRNVILDNLLIIKFAKHCNLVFKFSYSHQSTLRVIKKADIFISAYLLKEIKRF